MKKIFFGFAVLSIFIASCDKVANPYPEQPSQGSYDLYPDGDSAHYAANAWPTFSANTNSDRNILVEDFTGHGCAPCAAVGDHLETLIHDNNGRVVGLAIHAGPNGTGSLQYTTSTLTNIFYNDYTDELGNYFGVEWTGSTFIANPSGMVSRKDHGSGNPITGPSGWQNAINDMITTNDLKVNIQAASNYYSSTSGLFLHTEIEVLDQALTNELRIVSYLVEDSLIGPQAIPGGYNNDYVHGHILRDAIDGRTHGQILDAAHMDTTNGNYYFDYIYEVPIGYDNTNSHLVLFVRDAVTEEVYQVIKHKF